MEFFDTEFFGGLVQGLVPLLVLAAIVAAIVAWRRRERLEPKIEAEEGIGTLRRLYFYFGTFVYMMVASVGVVLVARYVLDELFGPTVLDRDVTQLALGLVLAVIWTPVWAWHRLRVLRLWQQEPAEARSLVRKVAVYLTLAVTAALVVQATVETLRWILGARSFGGYPIAALVVWSGLWLLTWTTERAEGEPTEDTRTVRRLYLYGTSTYSLVMLATGAAMAMYIVFREAYEGIVSVPVLLRGEETLRGDTMKAGLALAITGGAVWALHWLRFARGDTSSDLRQFYLYVLAVLGGVVTTLSATGVIVFGTLEWGIGTPVEEAAGAHFRFIPGALAPLLAGVCLWAYHWAVIQHERAAMGQLIVARRLYGYILAALGLGALAALIITLVPTVIAIGVTSAQDVLAGDDWWRDRIVLVLTLATVGAPVWGYHWYVLQRNAAQRGADERYSLPRRVFLFGAAGLGVLAFLGSASHLLFIFVNATLEDQLSLTLLRDAKWSMGVLSAAVLLTPYHWFVLQEDWQHAAPVPAQAEAGKVVTLLIAGDGASVAGRIEEALGAKVRVLERAEPGLKPPELSGEDIEALRRRIEEAPGRRVLLVAGERSVEVYAYR